MPRVNKKAKALASLTTVVDQRLKCRCLRIHDDDEDSVEDIKDFASAVLLSEVRKRRFYKRHTRYRKSLAKERFYNDLHIKDAHSTN
jgi:hypothetical protein